MSLGLAGIKVPKKVFATLLQDKDSIDSSQNLEFIFSASETAVSRSWWRYPLISLMMISFGPVTGYAATGVPQANASIITIPYVSVLDGKTKTEASE